MAGGVHAHVNPYLSELLQVKLERLDIHIKTQRGHGEQDVLAVDGLALFLVTSLAGFRSDEADKLAYALLYALLCIFCDL